MDDPLNSPVRKIGVLTSGGDSPGMNACIRAIFRAGQYLGKEIFGVRKGYKGLINGDIFRMQRNDVANIIHLGGTVLGTSRSPEFKTFDGRKKAADNLRAAGIDSLIVIGGDGTFMGGSIFAEETGFQVVGVPGTIDNNVPGTDFSIGFDTAINVALDSIDRIRDTAISHGRLFFVEVMGHTSGFIAIESGIAGGADYLIGHEDHSEIEALCTRLTQAFNAGRQYAIVVVAEGNSPGCSFAIAKRVTSRINIESRVCILGHTQRGGSPTARDRVLAGKLGVSAVLALCGGMSGVMVGEGDRDIVYVPLSDVMKGKKELDPRLTTLAHILSG